MPLDEVGIPGGPEVPFRQAWDRQLGLAEVVSFTAVTNVRSRAVMERIGLHHDPDGDFDHPSLSAGDPLRPHVLYRLTAERYGDAS